MTTNALIKRCDLINDKIDDLLTEIAIFKYQLHEISVSNQEFLKFKDEFKIPTWEDAIEDFANYKSQMIEEII